MKILITGGGGYLGTVLVRHLLTQTAHQVIVLDRFSWGTQPLASVATRPLLVDAADIRHVIDVGAAAVNCDLIVHLAAIVGYPACDADPEDAETTNVQGTANVVRAARARPILFASTGSSYGKVSGTVTEASPLSPLTRYGRTKAEAEKLVLDAGGTAFRFATLFGLSPRMRWDLLPNDFCRRGVAGELRVFDPEVRRTFLHVEDAAAAIVHWIGRHAVMGGEVYNVGDPALNLTKQQVADQVAALTDCHLAATEGHDPDERDYAVCYDKIRAMGWQAAHLLELGDVVQMARCWK